MSADAPADDGPVRLPAPPPYRRVVRDGLPPLGPGIMGTWPLNRGVKPYLGNVREEAVEPEDA